MLSDIRTEPDGRCIETDLCIIGGGAAAIAMALRLDGAPLSVAIFESGGKTPGTAAPLASGSTSGLSYFNLDESRIRTLGGSTWRWGARSAPMTPIDHQKRDWVPLSGWPIGLDDLRPYRDDVHDLVGLSGAFPYDGQIHAEFGAAPPAFDASLLSFASFQFGRNLLFGASYEKELAASKNVAVYLNANATNVRLSAGGARLEEAEIRTLDGKRFTARARAFVLACGGIENARLLLNWGLCNASGLVGRAFMEHPTVTAGIVHAKDSQALCDAFSPGLKNGRLVETGLVPSPAFQRDARILNAVARVRPVVGEDATHALREILWNLRHRKIPLDLAWYRNEWLRQRMGAIGRDPLSIPLNLLRHLQGKPKRFRAKSLVLEIRTEQAPNLESRVTLSEDEDPLGLRRAHLHWAMTALDKKTMRVMAETVGAEFERLGLGRLELQDWLKTDDPVFPADMVGGHHHMGTTRMSEDPGEGVVDADCKAHALENFYVAGSSVFPTASFVNPTFTILCLALRLGDHLRAKLAVAGPAPRKARPTATSETVAALAGALAVIGRKSLIPRG